MVMAPFLEAVLVPPRIETVQPGDASKGLAALEFARAHGVEFDPWQEHVFVNSLRTRADGKWSALEVGLVVPRQNGKTELLVARDLVGLFLFGEKLITHSAHRVDAALEAYRRLLWFIEENDDLSARVKKVVRTNGKEGIELVTGERIRFSSRSTGGGKGFTGNLVIFDEAMFLAESFLGALMPTMSAMSMHGNPQQFFAGSAVDQWVHENGVVFARVRERGLSDAPGRLTFFEWSFPTEARPAELLRPELEDRDWWAAANPALGVRIAEEFVASELAAMDNRTFAVERGCAGDWPRTEGCEESVLSIVDWMGLVGEGAILEPLTVAFDVSPERSVAVAVAGRREDGLFQVEVTRHKQGTSWLPEYLEGLCERRDVVCVVCDGYGGAASLVNVCGEVGVRVETSTGPELAQACGRLVDAVNERHVRHLGSDELLNALRGAKPRPLGDAWAWSRKNSSVDISPLVAATLALSAAMDQPEAGESHIW